MLNIILAALLFGVCWGQPLNYSEEADIWKQFSCTGKIQSPIDFAIDITTYSYLNDTLFVSTNYTKIKDPTISPINNGERYGLQQNLGTILFKYLGNTYQYIANEFSFHIPSEHKLGGESAAVELQVNHTLDRTYVNSTNLRTDVQPSQYLVISVFFLLRETYVNTFLKAFTNFRATSTQINDSKTSSKNSTISRRLVEENLPTDLKEFDSQYNIADLNEIVLCYKIFNFYIGSMTIPPCTEEVFWLIQDHFFYLSDAQFEILKKIIGESYTITDQTGNNRVTQNNENAQNGRVYLTYNNSISVNILYTFAEAIKPFYFFTLIFIILLI